MRLVLIIISLWAVVSSTPAAPHVPPAEAWTHLPPHPRLFATTGQWRALETRLTTDADTARLFAVIRAEAEALLTKPPVGITVRQRGKMSGTILEPAREIQRRVLALGATARLTGESRFTDRALRELRVLLDLPDWNPAVFLDTAEATLAAAVGFDWLYDSIPTAERDALAASIAKKGLMASFDSPAKMLSWVHGTNNWNQVCHGALVVGALAIAERDPELAQRTVARAVTGLPSSAKAYAPDGVYPEGPAYWSYGTTFHVAMLAALESALGERCGLDTFPGFLATGDYLDAVTAPSGDTFNYSDSSAQRGFEPALVWFARQPEHPATLFWERRRLRDGANNTAGFRSRFLPLALLWWDNALSAKRGREPPLNWKGDGAQPLAVLRSSITDPSAAYVAIKGGRAGLSHGHMDVGSFILECDGVRWAVDPGGPNYTTAYQAGIDSSFWSFKQESPRWTVFRASAAAHNILRFDQASPRVDGYAGIIRFNGTSESPFAQLDLSAVYLGQVLTIQRGVMLLHDRRIVLQDEWQTLDRSTTISWQWLTRAALTLESGGATLRQAGKTLHLRIVEPAGTILDVEEISPTLQKQDEPEPALRRLTVRTTAPASTSGHMVIVAEPASPKPSPQIVPRPLAEW